VASTAQHLDVIQILVRQRLARGTLKLPAGALPGGSDSLEGVCGARNPLSLASLVEELLELVSLVFVASFEGLEETGLSALFVLSCLEMKAWRLRV